MLNLNFSKLVSIGLYTFDIDGLLYEHELFITEDAVVDSKYYLIDIAKNVTKKSVLEAKESDILLESLCICELSIKRDIPFQISKYLKQLGFVDEVESVSDTLKNIDISFFEVRYNFYKNARVNEVDDFDSENILCTFFKVKKRLQNGSFGAIVEDIGLFNIKKMIYSSI